MRMREPFFRCLPTLATISVHGARGGAPKSKANGAWKHGQYSNEAREVRRECAEKVGAAQLPSVSLRSVVAGSIRKV
jgi:hypothetical protein